MSPTFSASSKTRKKLSLIERNVEEEEFRSVTFSTSKFRKNVFIEKNEDYTVSIYTCEEILTSPGYPMSPVTLTGSKPCDPFTNKQKDVDLEKMGLSECSSSMSSPQRDSVKVEGSESTDFEDDSNEEFDEEKQGILYKVMKLLVVLSAIVLSTLYISSMNPPKTGHFLSLQGYQSFQDSANDFALGTVFLNQTLGREPSFREATESVTLAKSRTVFDQIRLSDEGEVATETSDLLQVSVNDNVGGQVLEDSSKLSDPLDLNEDREIRAENLRLPYVTGIQVFPISIESTDEVLFDEKVTACEGTGEEEMDAEHQVGAVVNMLDAIRARTNLQGAEIVDKTDSFGESAKMEGFSYKIDEQRIILGDVPNTCNIVHSAGALGDDQTMRTEAVTDVVLAGTGEEEMDAEHQLGTVVNVLITIGTWTKLQGAGIVDKTDSSGESAKMEGFSYKIDKQRIILGDVLSTCEVVDFARALGDDQTMRTEAMVTDVVLAMGGISSLLGGIALLTITLRLVWRVFTKPSESVPSPVIQEYVEPVLVEDSRDLLLAKGESTEEKEQFDVERRLIELCHFRAPTVELVGEYVVSPEFSRSSLKKCTRGSSPVETQQTKQEIFPDSPSVSASCSNTSLDPNQRFGRYKIVMEEEGSTTVLRRSSRIRNKMLSSQL